MPNLSEMFVPNPYGDREGRRRADLVVAESARYAFSAARGVKALAEAFAAYVAAEKGADSALALQVQGAADSITAAVADVDADVAGLSAHLGVDPA